MNRFSMYFLAGLLVTGNAWAQQLPMDADGDGALSLPELQAARPEVTVERFTQMDANGDGLLTLEELRGRGGVQRRFPEGIDADGDGALSFTELQTARPEITEEQFSRMDRNGDGLISADERPDRPLGRRGRGGERPSRPGRDAPEDAV